MVRSEFEAWAEDFATRFPDIGKWMLEHPGTLKLWFEQIFQPLNVKHCMEANKQLMAAGVDIRDSQRIPAKMLKIVQDLRWKETEAANVKQTKESDVKARRNAYKSPVSASMRDCAEALTEWRHKFLDEHGRASTGYENRNFIDAWFDERE